jgi:hypothetical protein
VSCVRGVLWAGLWSLGFWLVVAVVVILVVWW